jgi:hypothetical protein
MTGWRWGFLVCLVAGHNWSHWTVSDADNPSVQTKYCDRCGRTKTNQPPTPISAWRQNLP